MTLGHSASSNEGGEPSPPSYSSEYNSSTDTRREQPNYYHNNATEWEGLLPRQNYGTVESTPLDNAKDRMWTYYAIFLLMSLIFGAFIGSSMTSFTHAKDWANEEAKHALVRQAWSAETINHETVRLRMVREATVWEARVAERALRWENERISMDDERKGWARERAEHDRWHEEERTERERKQVEEEAREQRRREEEEAREKRRHEEENAREQRRREEEERQRREIVWEGLEASPHCLRYGTREYTATLFNVPLGADALDECAKKPVDIHGREVLPSYCTYQGACGRVTGHWIVDFNEALCSPWWSYFRDKGCDQGQHRYEAPLENLQSDDHWKEICETTPAVINGVHYSGPTSCVVWGKYKWGLWFVDSC